MAILTVGHSTRSLAGFLAMLQAHGVRRLVDVRRFPGSRRHPHFARERLAPALAAEGIAYVHAPELGGRRPQRGDSPNTAWRSPGFRAYADHMASPDFRAWVARLADWAPASDTAVMCAEAVPWRCHRQLIADALVARGVPVAHVLDAERSEPHSLSPHARVAADASVTYPHPEAPARGRQPSLFDD